MSKPVPENLLSSDAASPAADTAGADTNLDCGNGEPEYRARCYRCYRPVTLCFCEAIPDIDNRIEVLIIQDRRERFHAFNTARIVAAALRKGALISARQSELLQTRLPLHPDAGVLYPGPDSILIEDLAPEKRPSQLVVLDGTWHHAKQLFRKLPQIQSLPRYRIDPKRPGNYRIRKEPNEKALSTIEATVCAMKALEPDTVGWDALEAAFTTMIDRQIAHPRSQHNLRYNTKRVGTPFNIPVAIVKRFENLVVGYGESAAVHWRRAGNRNDAERASRLPVSWSAKRLSDGAVFQCTFRHDDFQPDEKLLEHLELTAADFDAAVDAAEFRERWSAFLQEESELAVYNQSSLELLRTVDADFVDSIVLKCVDLEDGIKNGPLHWMLHRRNLTPTPIDLRGRSGRRLAGTVAVTEYLRSIVDQCISDSD